MTANQLAYQANMETIRHNLVTEATNLGNLALSARDVETRSAVGQAQIYKYQADIYRELADVEINKSQLVINMMDAVTRRGVGESQISLNKANTYKSMNDVSIGWYKAQIDAFNSQTQRLSASAALISAMAAAKTADTNYQRLYSDMLLKSRELDQKDKQIAIDQDKLVIDWKKLQQTDTSLEQEQQRIDLQSSQQHHDIAYDWANFGVSVVNTLVNMRKAAADSFSKVAGTITDLFKYANKAK